MSASNKEKHRAHGLVAKQVKAGNIERMPCETCGEVDSVAHHEDYGKPLDVMWLCRRCHVKRHLKLGWGKPGRVSGQKVMKRRPKTRNYKPCDGSMPDRIRALIESTPLETWTICEVAEHFGIKENVARAHLGNLHCGGIIKRYPIRFRAPVEIGKDG
jgi:hypothetical protein